MKLVGCVKKLQVVCMLAGPLHSLCAVQAVHWLLPYLVRSLNVLCCLRYVPHSWTHSCSHRSVWTRLRSGSCGPLVTRVSCVSRWALILPNVSSVSIWRHFDFPTRTIFPHTLVTSVWMVFLLSSVTPGSFCLNFLRLFLAQLHFTSYSYKSTWFCSIKSLMSYTKEVLKVTGDTWMWWQIAIPVSCIIAADTAERLWCNELAGILQQLVPFLH
jgi:hypothetical protein